jgi:EmrB/QacA subfamily drug resistance transporter
MIAKLSDPILRSANPKIANSITLVTACFATCLDILNLSAVNIAVPSIASDIGLTTSTLPWLIASYAIAFAAFLLPAGKLGDMYGYRVIYLAGLAIFGITSLINGLSPNQYVLFVFRAFQGLAAACTIPNGIALIANCFEDEDARRKALSTFGGSGPIGFTIGIILGGVLSYTIGWRWIFYISAICSFLMFVLAGLYVPNFTKENSTEKVDILGFLLVTCGFILVIFPLSDGQWKLARDPVTLVVGVLLIAAFILWEFKAKHPLLQPSWWRRTNFAMAFTIAFINYAAFNGYIYVATLMFQDAFGYSAIETALYFLPMGIVAFFMANGVGYLTPYTGSRIVIVIGAIFAAASNIGALFYSKEIGFWKLIFPMHIIMGLGLPAIYVAGQNAMIVAAPANETGTLGAVYNTAGQLGSAVGLAIMTAIIDGVNQPGAQGMDAYPGYHNALYANIGLEGICAIISIIFITDDRKRQPKDINDDVERGKDIEVKEEKEISPELGQNQVITEAVKPSSEYNGSVTTIAC